MLFSEKFKLVLPLLAAGLALPLTVSAGAGTSQPTSITAHSLAKSDSAIGRTLAAAPSTGWASVILRVGSLTATQETQIQRLGGDITRRLPIIQSVAVHVPNHSLAKLAALPFIQHLSLDGNVQKTDEFTVAFSEAGQAFDTDSRGSIVKLTGRGVTVAVIDSGITPVTDLNAPPTGLLGSTSSRILANVNLSSAISSGATTLSLGGSSLLGLSRGTSKVGLLGNGGLLSSSNNGNSYDPCEHGMHVAGIIAGNGAKSTGHQPVARPSGRRKLHDGPALSGR